MRARTVLLGCLASGVLLTGGVVTASANLIWCVSDPPVQLVTPGGHNLTVNNMVYLPPAALHLKNQIHGDAAAAADGNGGTLIIVHVYLPPGLSAHVVASENRFQISSEEDGDQTVTLYLDVPVS